MKFLDLRKESVERILLIRLRNIGDVLLMVPAIRTFRSAFPRAFIAAVVNAGTEEMLTNNPLLDDVLVFDPHWKELAFAERVAREMEFIGEIRRRRCDLAVNMTEGDRGAFLCLASGAKYKVGLFNNDHSFWWKKHIYDHIVRIPDWKAHMVDQILEIPRSLGLYPPDKQVDIFYSPTDLEKVNQLLLAAGVQNQDPLVHIHPTSRWLFKCWRDEGMARVIDDLQEKGRVRVVLTSGTEQKELEKIKRILQHSRTNPVNLAGKTSLKHLAALSQRCLFFIGVDTAPMHIAAAVGTPVIALFGPSGEFNWAPWGEGHAVIKKDMECRPCGKDGCHGSKWSRCLEEISEEEVLEKAFQFLSRAKKSAVEGVF